MGAPTLQSLATYAEAFSDRELALPRHVQLRCRSGNFSRLMWRGSDREFGRSFQFSFPRPTLWLFELAPNLFRKRFTTLATDTERIQQENERISTRPFLLWH